MPKSSSRQNYIGIYHKDCIDGTTAAAILLKKFPNIKLFPLKHYRKPGDITFILKKVTSNTVVYIVDFSLSPEELQKFTGKARSVINIDHHIGVKEKLEHLQKKFSNYTFIFDNKHSGASLTWIHLFKQKIPPLIYYVEQNDIHKGRWQDSHVAYTTSYLSQLTNQPEHIKKILSAKNGLKDVLANGKILTAYNTVAIKHALDGYEPIYIKIKKYSVPSYNAPEFLRSHIGHAFSKKHRRAVNIFALSGTMARLHFRSQGGQKPSALELAQALGGNGHTNAAGARVPLKKFLKMVLH